MVTNKKYKEMINFYEDEVLRAKRELQKQLNYTAYLEEQQTKYAKILNELRVNAEEKDNYKVYISGAITNDPDYKQKFKDAQKKLKKDGYIPVNPTWIQAELAWEEYMYIDLAMLHICDAVYMMKGWKESNGAKIEYNMAMLEGKEIIFEE